MSAHIVFVAIYTTAAKSDITHSHGSGLCYKDDDESHMENGKI